jgi:hypothetical protein
MLGQTSSPAMQSREEFVSSARSLKKSIVTLPAHDCQIN